MKIRRLLRSPRQRKAFILAGSITALITYGSAHAANQTWSGGSLANGVWSTVANWVGGAAPGATSGTTSADIATFNAAIANTWGSSTVNPIVIDSGRNISGINFDGAAGNYFVGLTGGNTLNVSSGGTIQILNTLTATNAVYTINAPLKIQGGGGSYTLANNSANGTGAGAGTLNIGGGITGGAAGNTVLTLSGSNTNGNTISGVIADGSATTLGLLKTGVGTWLLGANTYSGGTVVNGGTLTVGSGGSLGATTGTLSVNNPNTGAGTAVVLNLSTSAGTTTGSLSGAIATPSSGSNTATINNGGQPFTVNQTAPGTFAGVIAGGGSFTLGPLSTSTLTLTGAETYTGGTTVQAGTLVIGPGASIGDTNTPIVVGSTLGDNGTLGITGGSVSYSTITLGSVAGSTGTMTVSGGNWTGGTLLNNLQGTVVVGNSGTGVLNISGGSGTASSLTLGSAAGSTGTMTVSGGTWTSAVLTVGNAGTGVLNITGGSVFTTGSASAIVGSLGTATVSGGNWVINATGIPSLNVGGVLNITGGSVAAGFLQLQLGGTTTVSGGILMLTSPSGSFLQTNGVLNVTGTGIVDFYNVGAASLNSLQLARVGTSSTLNLGLNGGAGGFLATEVTASLGAQGPGVVNFNQSGGYDFVPILDGKLGVNQIGTGTTLLSGTNSYIGATKISAGQLIATNSSALNPTTGGAVTVAAGAGLGYEATADAQLGLSTTLAITGGPGTVLGGSIGSTATSAAINVTGAASATGAVRVNVYGIDGVAPATGVYTLLSGGATSSLNGATYTLNPLIYNNTNFTVGSLLAPTATALQVNITSATALTTAYWVGGLSGATNVWAASNGSTASNWAATSGGPVQALIPGPTATVTISNAPGATVLGANMSIAGLTIADTVNGLRLNADGYALTVGNGAVTMNAGVPASTIGADVVLANSNGSMWAINSTNSLTVSGSVSSKSSGNEIFKTGPGTLILSGASTFSGAIEVDGGTLQVPIGGLFQSNASAIVGNSGSGLGNSGTLIISGGALIGKSFAIAAGPGSSGTVTVSGGRLTASSGTSSTNGFLVGQDGTGVLNFSSGIVSADAATFGLNSGASGTVTMSGGVWTNGGALTIGSAGTGVLNLSGGSISDTSGTVGRSAGASGTVTVSGGTWANSINLTVGNGGTGVLNIVGPGVVQVGGTLTLGATGTIVIGNGGAAGTLSVVGSFSGLGGQLIFSETGSFSGAFRISGSISVNQVGPGTTLLTGANSGSGSTAISGGTLVLGYGGTVSSNIIGGGPLTMGGGTLQLTNFGNQSGFAQQSVSSLTTAVNSTSQILLGANDTLFLHTLLSAGSGSALNFNMAAGGATGATLGTDVVVLTAPLGINLVAGSVINSGFTVTDASGFGLATVDGSSDVIRATTTALLPASGASAALDYQIDNNAGTASTAGSATLTISAAEAAQSVTVDTTAASGGLTLNSGIVLTNRIWNFGGVGSNPWRMTGSGSGTGIQTVAGGNLYFNDYATGPITIGVPILANGANSVFVSGPGTVIFSAVNTYTGTTFVNGGTLEVTTGGAISGSDVAVSNGTLNLTGTGVVLVGSGAGPVTLGSNAGSVGTLNVGTGGVAGTLLAGTVTSGAGGTAVVNFNHTGSYAFAPVLAGKLSVNQLGAGTTIFNGANTYTGATTISAGQLIVTHGSALNPSGGGAVTVAAGAGLSYVAAANVPLVLHSTLAITGGAGTILGGSIGSAGTSAAITVAGAASATGAVQVNIYGTNGVTPSTGTYTLLSGGAGSSLNGATYTLGPLVYNETNFTVGALLPTATALQVGITSAPALTTAYWVGGLSGVTNVWAVSNGSTASNWAATSGGAVQALVPGTGANVTISATAPVTAPVSTVLGANMSIAGLTIADTVNGLGLNADGFALTLGSGGLTVNAGVPASTIAANVVLGASQTWTNNSANALTVSGAVSGSVGLAKAGTGTLILSGANTFTGNTTVSGGTLQVPTGGVINTTSANMTVGSLNGDNGTLNLTGGSVANFQGILGNSAGASGTATMSGGTWTNSSTFTVGNLGTGFLNLSGGSVSDDSGSMGSGTGSSGTATVSGGTWTTSNTLTVGNLGTGLLSLSGGSVSDFQGIVGSSGGGSGTATVSGGTWTNSSSLLVGNFGTGVLNLTGSGVVQVGGSGTGTLALANSVGSVGILNLGTGGVAGTLLAGTVTGGGGTATVNFNHTGSYTFAPQLTGSLKVNKLGAGTTTLTATNTYTGATTISAGELGIGGTGSLGGGVYAGNIVDNGTLRYSSSAAQVFFGAISGGGALIKDTANSTLTLSNTNPFNGTTAVNQGTLLVSGSISGSTTTVTGVGSTLGGTGRVGDVSVGSGAILEGGDGSAASGALTSSGNISLLDASFIELTLDAGGTHSSLARTGTTGTWSFDSDQAFTINFLFPDSLTYDNVISGLNGTENGLLSISTWHLTNPGITGTFTYDTVSHGVDLTLSAIPEPGTAALLLAGLPLLGWRRRRCSRAQ